jgi:Janus kinase 2
MFTRFMFQEFLTLTNQWAFLQSSAVVRFYGVTLSSPVSMVTEYLKLGPLDTYLSQNHGLIKQADLVEASTCLATALWHMVCLLMHYVQFFYI